MSLLRQTAIQSYPKIQIDPASVIKPCLASQTTRDAFVERPVSGLLKLWKLIKNQGILLLLKAITTASIGHTDGFKMYAIRLAKIFAAALLQLHQFYSSIYAYFYPYSALSNDVLCDEFAPCLNWSSALIRAFAWHPACDRCAVAICNDFIHIYVGSQKKRILRHHHQKKIVDMVWHPTDKDVIAVATQTHIILWRLTELKSNVINAEHEANSQNVASIKPLSNTITNNLELLSSVRPVSEAQNLTPPTSLKVFDNLITPPITSIAFSDSGDSLYICSPNSSSIVIIKIESKKSEAGSDEAPMINYSTDRVSRFGQCITKMVMSPDKVRLAVSITSKALRVFETLQWSSKDWCGFSDVIQHMAWSRPSGRVLLIAPKNESCLYAIPFFDEAKKYDVGGIQSMIKALDLSEKLYENDSFIGGRVHSFVWDQNGRRLAISFKDNPESILLFRTTEKPSVEFQQLGVIQGENNAVPLVMEFHDKFKDGSLLTVCWSDGNCQHIPMSYSSLDENLNPSARPSGGPTGNASQLNSSRTLRPLTNFCHSSGTSNGPSLP